MITLIGRRLSQRILLTASAFLPLLPLQGLAGEPNEEGIIYFGDGAWGVNVRPVRPAEDYGYMAKVASKRHAIIMTLQGKHLSFEVICEDGDIIDRFPEMPQPAALLYEEGD